MRVDTDIYAWDVAKIVIEHNDEKNSVTIRLMDKDGVDNRQSFHLWGLMSEDYKYSAPLIEIDGQPFVAAVVETEGE